MDAGARAWEVRFKEAARGQFQKELKDLLAALKRNGEGKAIDEGDLFSRQGTPISYQRFLLDIGHLVEVWGAEWRSLYHPLLRAYTIAQGRTIAASFGISFDMGNAATIAWLEQYTMTFAEALMGVTEQSVRDRIIQGQSEGWSIPQMTDSLTELYRGWSEERAETIARTETIRSSNAGSQQVYQQAGIERKQWLAAMDPCEFCGEMEDRYGPNTEGIGVEEIFYPVGSDMTVGEGEEVRRITFDYEDVYHPPLHPNCRCTILPVIERS